MTSSLSLLCVTQLDPHAAPFLYALSRLAHRLPAELVIAIDGEMGTEQLPRATFVRVRSKGYIESVLDEALSACTGDYVLRLDDDERASPAMVMWLESRNYLAQAHWKFPRQHIWPDADSVMMTPQLWPDCQTRLSLKRLSGGRTMVHAGSPYGGGIEAPVCIEHYKFLVKGYEERRAIAARYDSVSPGFGTGGMTAFSLPEDAYRRQPVRIVEKGDGTVPWTPRWEYSRPMHGEEEAAS